MKSFPTLLGLVLLQSWAESREDSGFHPLMVAESRHSRAFSNIRLTITAFGFSCP